MVNITASVENSDQIIHTNLSNDFLIGDLRAYLADEVGFNTEDLIIVFTHRELNNDKLTLSDAGLQDDEFLILRNKQQQQPITNDNAQSQVYQELMRLQQDPHDPNNQKRILELIKLQRIDENLQNALELSPESFTSIHMLYINIEVNGIPVKAFVDSGAQTTIMNEQLAKRCDLTDLIDKRFQGKAIGVGEQAILGKIHSAPIKIDGQFIPCSFTVINTSIDLLIGLDMLRRYQAIIDLKQNKLIIGDDIKAEFLHETEIPKNLFNDPQLINGNGQILQPDAPSRLPNAAAQAAKAAQQRSQQTQQRSQQTQQTQQRSFDEAVVQNLIGLGFSRQQVIHALESTQGNADLAAALLFQ